MILRELRKLLNNIVKCHPESENADVWSVNSAGKTYPISFVGLDKRHKPNRIKLEQ
jgi:hypothetical protein